MSRVLQAEGQVDRLPKWAQRYVDGLERRVASLEAELAAVVDDDADSPMRLYPTGYMSQPRGIPEQAALEWGHNRSRLTVSVRRDENNDRAVLEVSGFGAITVTPRASNLIWVTPA